jgi:hypothetical protein
MEADITKEDLERFQEFEKTILNIKENKIKYKQDLEMEAKIKMAVLADTFGEEKTKEMLEKIMFEESDLADQDTYIKIYNFLSSIK